MENLITRYQNDKNILKGIKELKLLQEHPKFKIGQTISFFAGYSDDIHFKSKIVGFDKDGCIYVLWDCYWSPINDDKKRRIKIINIEYPFSLEIAKSIWEKLGDVPVNEDDELDEDFIINEFGTTFIKGTDKIEVWHWFEETFNLSVAKDLMFI